MFFGGTNGSVLEMPPSTGKACPVTYDAWSLAGNNAAPAISSGWPARPREQRWPMRRSVPRARIAPPTEGRKHRCVRSRTPPSAREGTALRYRELAGEPSWRRSQLAGGCSVDALVLTGSGGIVTPPMKLRPYPQVRSEGRPDSSHFERLCACRLDPDHNLSVGECTLRGVVAEGPGRAIL